MEATDVEPRWPKYGLRGDPFFSGALVPDEAGSRPIHLFRGRQAEREHLLRRVRDAEASATAIIAEGGYGKTSLASRIAHDLRKDYLVVPNELAFHHDQPAEGYYFDLLDGIIRGLLDRGVALPRPPKDPARDAGQDRPHLLQVLRLVAMYRESIGLQVGLSLGPFLVQTGGGQLVRPSYHPRQSRELLRLLFQDLRGYRIRGVIVRLNNLDEPFITGREDTVQRFLHETRDLFQETGYHHLLCGNRDLATLIAAEPRVNTVFGPPTVLEDFSADDVRDILRARYEHLSIGGQHKPPVTDALVKALHGIHHGDLRNILKDLRTAMELARPVAAEPVDLDAAMRLLEEHHLKELADLREHDWELLGVLDRGPRRSKDLAGDLHKTPGRISQIATALRRRSVIEECDGPQTGTYLRLTGRSHLAMQARGRA